MANVNKLASSIIEVGLDARFTIACTSVTMILAASKITNSDSLTWEQAWIPIYFNDAICLIAVILNYKYHNQRQHQIQRRQRHNRAIHLKDSYKHMVHYYLVLTVLKITSDALMQSKLTHGKSGISNIATCAPMLVLLIIVTLKHAWATMIKEE
eukprot:m.84695 g.84695  ORF g.84695 m.84695 type:complete len:154 (-) comp25786_c0_seq1:158-619(-)